MISINFDVSGQFETSRAFFFPGRGGGGGGGQRHILRQ